MEIAVEGAEASSWLRRCVDLLASVLPRGVDIAESGPNRVIVNGTAVRLAWAGDGWLPDVRRVLAAADRPEIVGAHRMSPGARAELLAAGIGWADETGAAEIAIGPIIVVRPGLVGSSRPRSAGWTAATEAVAEALLCGTAPTVDTVAEATGLSTGSCVVGLRSLTDLGLLTSDAGRGRSSGRRLDNRDRLLDAYAAAAAARRRPPSIRVGVTWRDVVEGTIAAGRAWTATGIAWAATGVVASEVIAPHLTNVNRADVYIAGRSLTDLARAATAAGLRPVEGGRLQLLAFPTTATSRLIEQVGEMMVAPWPRVFADLRESGVRGEDVAEHLREIRHGR